MAQKREKISESSKTAVIEIQKVTKQVLEAVEGLISSSGKVLEFIDRQVVKDYEILVETGEQYSKDAGFVNEFVTNLSSTSEELLVTMQNMTKAINEVASAANEGAQGTTTIAQKASAIVGNAALVVERAQSSAASAEKLMKDIKKFTI